MLTLVRSDPVPAPRSAVGDVGPALRWSSRAPQPGARTVASDAGVTAEYSAMAWVSDDGRWWVCRERPAPSQFAELVAFAAAVSHHPGQPLRMLTDLEPLAGLVTGWRAGGVHRWPSMSRVRDRRLERIVSVLQRRVAERAGRHDEVTARHVHGHRGHPLNTAADRLCRHALTSSRIDPERCQAIVEAQLGYAPGSVGHPDTRLVVLHGGSSGDRDQVASEVRRRCGPGCALVLHDDLSHLVLGERDEHAGALVAQVAAFALDAGQHVVCDVPKGTVRDRPVLRDLDARHRGRTTVFELGTALSSSGSHSLDLAGGIERAAQQIIDHSIPPRKAAR